MAASTTVTTVEQALTMPSTMRLAALILFALATSVAASPPVPPPDPTLCQQALDDAADSVRRGFHAEALARLERANTCGKPLVTASSLFGQACRAKDVKKAWRYYHLIPAAERTSPIVWCVADGMSYDVFAGTDEKAVAACAELEHAGADHIAMGQPFPAIRELEAANACAPSPKHLKLVVLAACRARNEAVAKRYFAKLSKDDQAKMAMICQPPSF